MTVVVYILRFLYHLAVATFDALIGRKRKRYATSVLVRAPQDSVWDVLEAHKIRFEGFLPVEISVAPRPEDETIVEGTITVGGAIHPIVYRVVSRHPPEAATIEVLKAGSHAAVGLGDDYFVSYVLAPVEGGTLVTLEHELTHTTFSGRLGVPIGAAQSARRIKTYCERMAGIGPAAPKPVMAAALTGALTYASFHYLFGWQFAAVLLLLILIHEAGHAVAMRWIGQPVQGIYFVPFLGGVAVAGAPHRSEAERGFVALMGPGLSLVTTAAFLALWYTTGEELFAQLTLVSAFLNGINLAPVLPLDGGHVVDAILSRSDPEMANMLNFTCLVAGVGAAVYLEWYVLVPILLLSLPMILSRTRLASRQAIGASGQAWLAAGYIASVAFYGAVVAAMMS